MTQPIGTPQYGAGRKKNFKLKDGSNHYRVLPPFGKLAPEGKWAIYESVHWGYKGSRGARNFRCIQEKGRDGILKRECPECTLIATRKADYDARLKDLVERQGKTKKEAQEYLKPLGDWLFSHNRDSKWYLNALSTSGEIGRLAIPHKMYRALQAAITGPNGLITKKNLDPIAIEGGVFFDLERTGMGNETNHVVRVVTELVEKDGDTFEKIKRAPLTDELLKRMQAEAYDLSNMYRTLTADEITRLTTSGGDPSVVDSVFTTPESRSQTATAGVGMAMEVEDEPTADELATAGTSKLPPLPEAPKAALWFPAVAPPATAVDPVAAEMAALMAKIDALKGQQAKSVAPSTPKVDAVGLSNADFLANFGSGKV